MVFYEICFNGEIIKEKKKKNQDKTRKYDMKVSVAMKWELN